MPVDDLLVPVRRCRALQGVFDVPRSVSLDVPPGGAFPKILRRQLSSAFEAAGCRVGVKRGGSATITLRRDDAIDGREAYRLMIRPSGIEILAGGDAGLYYAVQTLRQLMRIHEKTLPACRIDDAPDFARRGVYLDISRGKVPKLSTLKALVELLAHWKINEIQMNIENVFRWTRHPAIGPGYSPLSAADILSVQAHCQNHHVRLVGALACFGHQEKILQLPEYAHLAERPGGPEWMVGAPQGTSFCPTDPGSIRLTRELLDEFVPLFEAEDFNINCDEPWELGKGRSRRRAETIGLGRLYWEHVGKIYRIVRGHGKRVNLWSDIVLEHDELLPDLPRDLVILNWDYGMNPSRSRMTRTGEIASFSLPLMVCPGTHSWSSHGCRLERGMTNIARFAKVGRRHGAEGLLNTDWGDNGHRNPLAVSLHNFAWGAACSWAGGKARPEDFTERFCFQTFAAKTAAFPQAIRTLGTPIEVDRGERRDLTFLYNGFLLPRAWESDPTQPPYWTADHVQRSALRKRREEMTRLRWPAPKTAPDVFLANMFEEYALGARMDSLACLRYLALKDIHDGKAVPAGTWRKLIAETQDLADELNRIWRRVNRPSRLRDQLRGLRTLLREYNTFLKS